MLTTIFSILAAMFGVQSSKNYARDLSSGKLKQFIVVAILCLIGFILAVYFLVRLVLMKNGL